MSTHPVALLLVLTLSTAASGRRCALNPSTYDFKFGRIHGVVVSDGPLVFNPADFSVPLPVVRRSYRDNFRATDPIAWQQNVLVLDTPSGRVLVDAGTFNTPPQFIANVTNAGQLLRNLRSAGIKPRSVDFVLLTHAHPDHITGMIDIDGKAVFPRAEVYIGKFEHEFWTNLPSEPQGQIPEVLLNGISQIYMNVISAYKGRLKLVPKNGTPLPGFKFIPTPGHTPGHNSIQVTSEKETLLIAADAWISKPDQLQNNEWGFAIENNQFLAYKSRVRLLQVATSGRYLVAVYHEEFPGLGYVTRNGPSFDWIPASPQMLGSGVRRQC